MATAATADDWTSSAMRDGEVVAELLVKLKEAKTKPVMLTNRTITLLRWGIRQPRSRCPRKETESAKNSRCSSPSTPLSWSGGYGGSSSSPPSAYADGNEATSHRVSDSFAIGSRSKVIASIKSPFNENKSLKRMKLNNTQIYTSLAVETCKADGNFLLPDLNIMPCDENGDNYSFLAV